MDQGIRGTIDRLENAGLLRRITEEVDWRHQVGDLTRQEVKKGKNARALLFETIKNYPGNRILTNGCVSYQSIAASLGMEYSGNKNRLIDRIRERIGRKIRPERSLEAPICFKSHIGKEIDLTCLPVPWWSREDGGRYIGTWHLNITAHPDTGKRNVGVYRMCIIDPNHSTISVSSNSHLQKHYAIAEKRGQPLPMSVAIGVADPLVIAAASAFPQDHDEFTMAAGLLSEPVRLTKGLTIPVECPADAEIILEGNILPGARTADGPFFDYCGVPNTNPNALVFEVSAIRTRENPVFRGAAIGIPGAEDLVLYSLLANLDLYDFHGARLRHAVQGFLFHKGWHRLVQMAGKLKGF